MTDLADFLRARYAERRAIAEAASPWPWKINPDDPEEVLASDDILVADVFALSSNQTRNTATFIATNDPADVIADLDAKLAIIDAYLPPDADPHPGLPCINFKGQDPADYSEYDSCSRHLDAAPRLLRSDHVLRILARPFAGHTDYQEDWAA